MAAFFGTSGKDTLLGTAGDDFLDGGVGDDTLDGSGGNDTASYVAAAGPVTVNLALGTASGADGNDTLRNLENINGGAFADTLTGDALVNRLYGSAGNDTLNGGGGDDYFEGGLGDDKVDGGDGKDRVSYTSATAAVVVNLALGTATGAEGKDTLINVENISGSGYGDTLTGDSGANALVGLDGVDTLNGGDGDDTLEGGSSNDTIDGGAGDDTAVFSGNFADYTVVYSETTGLFTVTDLALVRDGMDVLRNVERLRFNDFTKIVTQLPTVVGSVNNDTLKGGPTNDVINGGAGDDVIDGGGGANTVFYGQATGPVTVNLSLGKSSGADGNDTLVAIANVIGSAFDDTLTGDINDNELFGGEGGDVLSGGAGSDALDGGTGADRMEGGSGGDTYVVDDVGDLVIEAADSTSSSLIKFSLALGLGNIADLVKASVSFTLPVFVENLTLAALAGNLAGTGNSQNNVLTGNEGNNTFTGAGGDDIIDGATGRDLAVYSSQKGSYALAKATTGWTVTQTQGSNDGNDTLANIERLQFSDKKFALDLGATENGGLALGFIGLMAPGLISTPQVVGTILAIFDAGKTMQQVCQLAIDVGLVTELAGSATNSSLAAMAYKNLIGAEASADVVDMLVGYMDGRSAKYTQTEFMAVVAGLELNQTHIGLVGFQQTGIEFS